MSFDALQLSPGAVDPQLATEFQVSTDGLAVGYVVDPQRPSERLIVELLADGLPIALLRANLYDRACALKEVGDGCYGFRFRLPEGVLGRAKRLEARLANASTLIGAIDAASGGFLRVQIDRPIGHVRWDGGLRLRGWIDLGQLDEAPRVVARLDGEVVASAVATGWTFSPDLGRPHPVRAFVVDVPVSLADGRVRSVEIATAEGIVLPGSPCLVFAVADGLAALVERAAEVESQQLRARFADRLLPQTMPFSELENWLGRYPRASLLSEINLRVCVIVIGEQGIETTLDSLAKQVGVDCSLAVLPSGASPVEFDSQQMLRAIETEAVEQSLFVFTLAGARFEAGALALLHAAACNGPKPLAVYADVMVEHGGNRWPLGFPAYDDELSLEQGIGALLFAVTSDVLRSTYRDGGSLYHVFAAACDSGLPGLTGPLHVAGLLATLPPASPGAFQSALCRSTEARLSARGIEATVTPSASPAAPAVHVLRARAAASVSVVIATRGGGDGLASSLFSLRSFGLEIVIADRGESGAPTDEILQRHVDEGGKVVRDPGWENLPRLLNAAASQACGDYLLFLAPGCVPAGADAIDEMLSRFAAGHVGVVGGLVHSSTGIIRHAGYVLGPRCGVAARFVDRRLDDPGYGGWLVAAHQCSAVSTTCMMTPRRLFGEAGGFDSIRLSLAHADVDYCLRLSELGHKTIFTPHARMVCDEPDAIRPEHTAMKSIAERQTAFLRDRWAIVPGSDPFYSPWLSMDSVPYSGLAWPPPSVEARLPRHPIARLIPPGF